MYLHWNLIIAQADKTLDQSERGREGVRKRERETHSGRGRERKFSSSQNFVQAFTFSRFRRSYSSVQWARAGRQCHFHPASVTHLTYKHVLSILPHTGKAFLILLLDWLAYVSVSCSPRPRDCFSCARARSRVARLQLTFFARFHRARMVWAENGASLEIYLI